MMIRPIKGKPTAGSCRLTLCRPECGFLITIESNINAGNKIDASSSQSQTVRSLRRDARYCLSGGIREHAMLMIKATGITMMAVNTRI